MPAAGHAPASLASARALGLDSCDRDLAIYADEAVARFGSAAIGSIDLPPLRPEGRLGRGDVRAIATLYWCWNLEKVGLPRFVEALAEHYAAGSLVVDPGARGGLALMRYERSSRERHTLAERRLRYSVLFGSEGAPDPNTRFPPAFAALVQALAGIDVQRGFVDPEDQVRVAMSAASLLSVLAPCGAGATRFDAERFLAHDRQALALLEQPQIRFAFGGGTPMTIIAVHAPAILGESIDPTPHVQRARAGAEVLRWVANHLQPIRSGMVPLDVRDPVLGAAAVLAVDG